MKGLASEPPAACQEGLRGNAIEIETISFRLLQKEENKHAYLFLESLREKGKLAEDCMRLIKYARSVGTLEGYKL